VVWLFPDKFKGENVMTKIIEDMASIISNAVDEALKKGGTANIIIAGKTGVGKSTLINAVFQGQMAETGQGKPVTQCTRRITKKDVPVAIYDTRGLEVKEYEPILTELMKFIAYTNGDEDPSRHIHVAWLCIAEGLRRVEPAEIQLAEALSNCMPVIAVITTALSDQGFKAVVEQCLPFAVNVVRINSLEQVLDGGIRIPPAGLDKLIEITMDVIPDGQKKAFVAAQRVKLDAKADQAQGVVASAAIAAGGIGAVPIPFSDAVGIVPIQIGMIAGITTVFGIKLDKVFLSTLVAGTFTSVAATAGGRALVGALLKFFPGLNAVGSVVSAGVAAMVTTAFGEAYIATLYALSTPE
jgi:uncharacterized protein (DUF697 family)